MSTHPGKMIKIWDQRIKLVRDRIQALRQRGFGSADEDVHALYDRLKYFQECRKCAVKDLAWEECRAR